MNKKAIKILKYFFKQGIKILQCVLLYFWRLSLCKMATSSRLYSTTFSVIVVSWSSVLKSWGQLGRKTAYRSKNKNCDGFRCMRMILVMSVWFNLAMTEITRNVYHVLVFWQNFFFYALETTLYIFFRQNRLRFMLIWHNKAIKSRVQNRLK